MRVSLACAVVAENRGFAVTPGGAGGAALIIALARRRRALAVVGASAAVLLMRPASADACSYPPHPPRVSVTATRDGVLSLGVSAYEAMKPHVLEVETGDGAPVAGATERVDGRVVWRPAQALVPGETYRARLFVEAGGERRLRDDFAVVVLDADAPDVAAPVVESIEAAEVEAPVDQLCCDEGVTSCGDVSWRRCWAQAYDYPVDVTVRLSFPPERARGVVLYRAIGADGTAQPVLSSAVVRLPGRAARYCVDIEAFDVIRGSSVRSQVCTDELRETERHAIETPDVGLCFGDIVDADTREVVIRKTSAGDGDVGGCSAGGGASVGIMFALLGLRRRRRQPSAF